MKRLLAFVVLMGTGANPTVAATALLPHTPIHSLQLRLSTADVFGAGTGDAIYFGIGGMTWRLPSDTKGRLRGKVDVINLPICGAETLYADDVRWLRLEKKGWFGLRRLPDGIGGAWRPARIALIADGVEIVTTDVDRWLSRSNPSWTLHLDKYESPLDRAAGLLAFSPLPPLGKFARWIGFFTTPLKRGGISGWLDLYLGDVRVKGRVVREPAHSTDDLTTIDIQVREMSIPNETRRIDRTRFIRVEALHLRTAPKAGDDVTFCGTAKWDSDFGGWLEVHP